MNKQEIIMAAHKLGTPIYASEIVINPNPSDSTTTIKPNPQDSTNVNFPNVTDSTLISQFSDLLEIKNFNDFTQDITSNIIKKDK